jgi:ADP-ribose pyrophosphatase YjhB (NUDIX family)
VRDLIRTLHRLSLRPAYWIFQVYWFVARPRANGVKCVVMHGDRIVLVRHTYGRRQLWDLPGGGIKRGETTLAAARREVAEELGVELTGWRELGRTDRIVNHKRNRLYGCAGVAADEAITPDRVEIAEARWFARSSLPEPRTPWVTPFAAAALANTVQPDRA